VFSIFLPQQGGAQTVRSFVPEENATQNGVVTT
jgi:hypothetical protein